MIPPRVRRAHDRDAGDACRILTDAFVDEPGLNFWLRQDAKRDTARARFFTAALKDLVTQQPEVFVAEAAGAPTGAAIWCPVGAKAFDFTPLKEILIAPLLLEVAGLRGMGKALELGKRLGVLHPPEPHAHLVFLAVAPHAQGQGVGSAMLKEMLLPVDALGVAAYLETTTARNVGLYQRHGFEVSHEFDIHGVHFWTMTRAARR